MPNYNYREVSRRLAEWGKKKQILPPNNDAIKNKVLSAVRPVYQETTRPNRFRLFGGILAVAGACALLFILVSPTTHRGLPSPASNNAQGPSEKKQVSDGTRELGLVSGTEVGLGQRQENSMAYKIAQKINRFASQPTAITDTREFLKVGFSADIKTRSVEKLGTQIQTMARGYGGRIDEANINSDYATINFVIPKTALEAFKNELRYLVPDRFFSERISSVNLLPEKKQTEKEIVNANNDLEAIQTARKNLIGEHDKKITAWQFNINNITRDINLLKQENTTDTLRQTEIAREIYTLNKQKIAVQQKITSENNYFRGELAVLDNNLNNANATLENYKEQDQRILDNVETVDCAITLQWIGIMEIINLYVPIYWILTIGIIIFIAYLIFGRKERMIITP